MNAMLEYVSSLSTNSGVVALGWTLLHFVWQAILIALLLAFAWRAMAGASSNARYLVGIAGLLLIAVTPLATWGWLYSTGDLSAGLPWIGVATEARSRAQIDDMRQLQKAIAQSLSEPLPVDSEAGLRGTPLSHNQLAGSDVGFDQQTGAGNRQPDDLAAGSWGVTKAPSGWSEFWTARLSQLRRWLPFLVMCWSLGVGLFAVRMLVGLCRVAGWCREAEVSLQPHVAQIIERLQVQLQMRAVIRVLDSTRITVPAVIGVVRPVILLPASLVSGLTTRELELILAHELAHIRRHDWTVNLLQSLVEVIWFYHPAVWWVSQRIRMEREHCCDDIAVAACGDPLAYARALSRMEQMRCEPSTWVMAANGGSLLARIQRLVTPRPKNSSASWIAAWLSLACMVAISWGIVAAGQSAQQQRARLDSKTLESIVPDLVDQDPQATGGDDRPMAMVKYEKELVDSKTSRKARVFTDIELRSAEGDRRVRVGMKYSNVLSYTLIPARVAAELQAVPLGEIDFGAERPSAASPPVQIEWLDAKVRDLSQANADDGTGHKSPASKSEFCVNEVVEPLGPQQRFVPFPEDTIWLPDHLGFYDMNQSRQRRFKVVRIEKVDLGIGRPFGPINALVLEDTNSDFGVLGRDWAREVHGPANEVLCFAAAEAAWFLLPPPDLSAQRDAAVPPPTSAVQTGGEMSVSASWNRPPADFAIQPGLTRLLTIRYPRDKRSTTHYLKVDQQSYPVDRGLSHGGVWFGMTLMHDIVAVDEVTGQSKWFVPWQKSHPFWEHLAIVSFSLGDGSTRQSLELAAASDENGQVTYRYLDLMTGAQLDPVPTASWKSDPLTANERAKPNWRPLQVIRQENGFPREVMISAPSVLDPFELILPANADVGSLNARSDDLQYVAPIVSAERARSIGNAVDAEKIKFQLPAGSNLTARFVGEPIAITLGDHDTQLQLTRGRVELLDEQQHVRAWASADGGAEFLKVRYLLENGVPTLELTAERALRMNSDTELVQCVVSNEPSIAPAHRHELIDSQNYRIDDDLNASEFHLNWIVSTRAAAVLEALKLEESQMAAKAPTSTFWLKIGRLKHVVVEAPFISFQDERNIVMNEVGSAVEQWRRQQGLPDGRWSDIVGVDLRVENQTPVTWVLELVQQLRRAQIKRVRILVEPAGYAQEPEQLQATPETLSEYLQRAASENGSTARDGSPLPATGGQGSTTPPTMRPSTDNLADTAEASPAPTADDDTTGWGALAENSGLRSRITLQTEKPQVGQPLLVKLELKNFGQRPTTIDPQNYAPFRVLRMETGEPPQRSAPFIGSTPQTSAEPKTLAPGESHTLWEQVDLMELFLAVQPQQYVIYAEGGEWAAQTWWRDSNQLQVTLAPGELTVEQRLMTALISKLPPEWQLSQVFGDYVLSHSANNLKSEVVTYQLFFRQEQELQQLLDFLGQQQQPILRLGATVKGEAILSHTSQAKEQWPQAETLIREVLQAVFNERQSLSEPSDNDASTPLPWRATGRVIDSAGNPLAGVYVRAHTGIGTLRRTGQTQTDAQGNYVLDFGSGFLATQQSGVQAATISVQHPGYSETQLGQQGDLIAAWQPVDEINWGDKDQDDLFLPGKPREINFQMERAVTLQGQIIAPDGQPAANAIVSLTGKRLPPSSSVAATTKTDADGRFVLPDIPPRTAFQLVIESPRGAPVPFVFKTPALNFLVPDSPLLTGLALADTAESKKWEFDNIEIVLTGSDGDDKDAAEFSAQQKQQIESANPSSDGSQPTQLFRIQLGKVNK